MEITLGNVEKCQKMSKKNIIDNFVGICMNIAKNQLITAYVESKQALHKHFKKFIKLELQNIIFNKYDVTSITKYVLEKNNIIK